MGNTPSSSSRVPLGGSLLEELHEVQYEKSIGASRFLKAIRARHAHGKVVVKTFVKPDASLTLRHLVRRLRKERETLADVPNVLTYQQIIETDRAGYLVRQWLSSSLYDRISTRPFLTTIEKKWVTYQLLFAMKACREHQIPHGDLKTENIIVTTSLSVFVTDFAASFKPTFLPLDDPADFSFFFDTSGRRTCYIAPERFYTADSDIARQKASMRGGGSSSVGNTSITTSGDPYSEILGLGKRDGKVTEAMDVFALGCVIAELWRDGTPTFSLSQLFKYRERQFDLEAAMAEITEPSIRAMVLTMTSLEPEKRQTFAHHFEEANQRCFPRAFSAFLHPYLVDLQRFNPPRASPPSQLASRPDASRQSSSRDARSISSVETDVRPSVYDQDLVVRRQADIHIDRLWSEWSVIIDYLGDSDEGDASRDERGHVGGDEDEGTTPGDREAAEHSLPVQLGIPGIPSSLLSTYRSRRPPLTDDGPALVILSPLLANLRNALRATSKLRALDLLLHLSAGWLTDEAKLDRILPYVVALYDDGDANVRAAAIRASVQILLLVDAITPANENVCSEYVLPNLRRLASDPSPIVRTAYAAAFSHLICAAERFIQQVQALQASGALAAEHEGYEEEHATHASSYEAQMQDLRGFAQDQVTSLLTDSSAAVKRALLMRIEPICHLFGPAATNDVLLSHMITYLNDRDWLLRDAFFDAIISVGLVGGARSVEEYIVPLMLQALSDAEETVTVRVVDGLTRLLKATAKKSLLSKSRIYELISVTAGFLCHANLWIRQSEARFLEAAFATLDATDAWAIAYPSLRPLLKHELQTITAASLLETAQPPLSRNILNAALSWAGGANKTSFWHAEERGSDSSAKAGLADGLGKEGLALIAGSSGAKTTIPRTDEDDGYMDKLRAQGLSQQDETKLYALRDYLWRLARGPGRRSARADSGNDLAPGVQTLDGVTPQTIFFTHNSASSSTASTSGTASSSRPSSIVDPMSSPPSSRRIRPSLGGGSGHRIMSDGSMSHPGKDELRRRMASTSSAWGSLTPRLPTPSSLSSQRSVSSSSTATRLGVGSKAVPAVAEVSTTATGTMSDLAARLRIRDGGGSSSRGDDDARDGADDAATSDARTARPGEAPFASTYNGTDPHIQAHLEAVFVRNFRDRAVELAPTKVTLSSARRRLAAANARSTASSSSSTPNTRRPEGKLVAYFNEHTAPITAIAVSSGHVFFATASDDGTVKVWDTARLEKNVTSRSRITYSGHSPSSSTGGSARARITSLIALEHTHCLVSAATDGSLHVWRVDVTAGSLPRYGKPRLVSNFQLSTPGEYVTCILQQHSAQQQQQNEATAAAPTRLIVGTSQSRITVLDLRTMQVLQALRGPAHLGPITCMCADKRRLWLWAGTLAGCVVLWDLRFGLMVKSWRVGASSSDEADGVKVTGCAVHPTRGKGRWVLISCESARPVAGSREEDVTQTLIETWDIDRGVLVEAYECGPGRPRATREAGAVGNGSPTATSDAGLSSPAAAIERLLRLREEQDERGDSRSNGKAGAALPRPSSHVKSFLIGVEGYSSGSLSNDGAAAGTSSGSGRGAAATRDDVGGSWLDAGKLAAEAAEEQDGTAAGTNAPTGPAGYLLSGGEDCKIRFWDLGKPERSVVFGAVDEAGAGAGGGSKVSSSSASGSPFHVAAQSGEPTVFHHRTDAASRSGSAATAQPGSATLRSPLLSQQQTQPAQLHMRAHRDAVTALAVIEFPFRCVVAGDRTGAVKVWE